MTNELQKYPNIIIYGVGKGAQAIVEWCIKKSVAIQSIAVDCFSVGPEDCALIPSRRMGGFNAFSESDMWMDSEIHGIPVNRLDMLIGEKETSLIVVEKHEAIEKKYLQRLQNYRFQNILCISNELLEEICEELFTPFELYSKYWDLQEVTIRELQLLRNCTRRQLKPTIYDFHFEFHIVEHCNLGCRGCTHFSPLAKEEYLDIHEFERDMKRISDLTGSVARFINLLGGEPLLHPDLIEFFAIARKYFPDTKIRVVTNGILLLEQNEMFWSACHENKIIIGVTEYPINIDYGKIKQVAKSKRVDLESFSGDGVRDEMWKLSLDEGGKNRPMENFMRCPRPNACVFFSHGKIYSCATMANIKHFNEYFGKSFELCEWDFVDIYKVDSISEILEYLRNPVPFCRFCNIEKRTYGNTWAPSKKMIEEWI